MKGIRFFQTIQAKIIIIYVLLILMAMQLIGVYFVRTLESSFTKNFTSSLNKQADLLAEYVEPYLSANQEANAEQKKTYDDLNRVVQNLFAISNAEIQVVDANGIVRSTSQPGHLSLIGQKNTQPEVIVALQGIKDKDRTIVDTDGQRKKVIAKPVGGGGKVIGAVYIVASMEDLYSTMNRVNRILISGTLIALALTVILGVILSHTITNPIKEITTQATEVAEGNFEQKVKVLSRDEIGQLSKAFNYMTNRLKEALSINEEEREKLSSVLSNMSDGVIAADEFGKIIVMNRRASQMLQLAERDAIGHDLSEVLKIEKNRFQRWLRTEGQTDMQLYMTDEEDELSVRVTFSPIHRRDQGITGTIAVLQDVTEQEKLEQSRKEFVANVSHELRTPLTTLKSYLEALNDGAMDDAQLAQRFLGVARNETERMIRLVTDLLHLSRLDSKQAILRKEMTNIPEMLEEVADRFSFQLEQKSISISISVDPGVTEVELDRDQIDQVLDNLVSNSIKYTGDGGTITIRAHNVDNHWLELSIEDNGIGIPKKDLSRIFERFYRVDKARSRNMGGTGLGLSIAREIIKAHGGAIALESEWNQGTKVTFKIPVRSEVNEAI